MSESNIERKTMKPILLLLTCLIGLSIPMAGMAQPTITTQPKSQSVSLGANVTFLVKATGTAPLNYQWRFSGEEIAGAVTNSLSLTNVPLSSAGEYLAVVVDPINSS
jgi:Immunoglobulin domain